MNVRRKMEMRKTFLQFASQGKKKVPPSTSSLPFLTLNYITLLIVVVVFMWRERNQQDDDDEEVENTQKFNSTKQILLWKITFVINAIYLRQSCFFNCQNHKDCYFRLTCSTV